MSRRVARDSLVFVGLLDGASERLLSILQGIGRDVREEFDQASVASVDWIPTGRT